MTVTLERPDQIAGGSGALSLKGNALWNLVGNIVYAGSRWSLLAILAKLGTAEDVGVFVLGVAVVAPIVMFSQMQLRTVLITDMRQRFGFSRYFYLRIASTLASMLAIVAVSFWAYPGPVAMTIFMIGILYAIESIADIYYGLLHVRGRMDIIAISTSLRSVLTLVGLAAGFAWTGDLFWASIGMTSGSAITVFCYDVFALRKILRMRYALPDHGPDDERETDDCSVWTSLRTLGVVALPLGLTTTMVTLNTSVVRLILEAHLGSSRLGAYAVAASLVQIGGTLVAAVFGAALPRLALYMSTHQKQNFYNLFTRLLGMNALVGIGMVLTGCVAGKQVITLLFRAEYATNFDVTITLLAAGSLGYVGTFLGATLSAARRFKLQLSLSTVVTGVSALASWLLVLRFGLAGAAYATLVAMFFQLVIFAVAVQLVTRSVFEENDLRRTRRG